MRHISQFVFLFACASLLTAGNAAAQANSMEVSIVAFGKNNTPVEDLKQEDIIIRDNTKKQDIVSFTKITPGTPVEQGKPAIHNIVLIDVLNSTYRDLPENRLELLKTVAEMAKAGNIVVLMLRGKLTIVHDPTGGGLLSKLASQGTKGMEGSAPGLSAYDWVFAEELGLYQLFTPAGIFDRQRVEVSLGTLRTIAGNYQGRTGRKNLFWISQGFPLLMGGPAGYGAAALDTIASGGSSTGASPAAARGGRTPTSLGTRADDLTPFAKDMDFTARVLNNANIAVYPIDSRYLTVDDTTVSNKSMMEDIAKTTGGLAFTSRRDVSVAMREALADSKVVYVVRYAISDLKPDGRFHAIKVETSRKDVKMRYRGGYYAPVQR